MTQIIGLSGFAGSGKDTAAEALVEDGWERVAFADVLRDIAYAIDPYVFVGSRFNPWYRTFRRLTEVVDTLGWDEAKNMFPDIRRLLQRLGTEAGRDILGENIWVDTAFNRAVGSRLVVTDVRFPNEAEGIRARGGLLVRIERPGVGPRNNHPSETSLVDYDFDYRIDNIGTIEELHRKIRTLGVLV